MAIAVPFDPTDPRHLAPEQRLAQLTGLLAAGVRRALAVRAAAPPPESAQNGLDVSPQSRPHGPAELTQPESEKGVLR